MRDAYIQKIISFNEYPAHALQRVECFDPRLLHIKKDGSPIILADTEKRVLANHFYVCGSGALVGVLDFELYSLAVHERIGSLQL